jgi:hypothetical protein
MPPFVSADAGICGIRRLRFDSVGLRNVVAHPLIIAQFLLTDVAVD